MRPIDADTLYTLISKCESVVREEKTNTKEDEGTFLLNSIRLNEIERLKHLLDIVPILDIKPVMHGKWERTDITEEGGWALYRCSCCNWHTTYYYSFSASPTYNFCPNCGAKLTAKEASEA